jgi:hypothetical protein
MIMTSITINNILDTLAALSPEEKSLLINQLQPEKENINSDNPWVKLAGKYEQDPMYDEVLDFIQEYRQELDEEITAKDNSIDHLKSAN